MRKLFEIVVWATVAPAFFAAIIAFIPDQYRIHSALAKPVIFLPKSKPVPVPHSPTLVIGDSVVYHSPWNCNKISRRGCQPNPYDNDPRNTTDRIVDDIWEQAEDFQHCTQIFIVFGTACMNLELEPDEISAKIQRIEQAARSAFPSAVIQIIPPPDIREIALRHNIGDGWHPDDTGYKLIAKKYNLFQ